ncbi:MAG: type II toxin-antitoxin system VapC family toxin [Pseudomonadales bacterium]|jgi:predicted nucleic-acid-binding protein|nr:type II toxin-antitoxin system VapC family toxin [Pseudomonadales bacterium]
MRAIDTNVLVRLLVRDDAKQVARAEQFVAKGAWISLVTLVETAWVLASVYELEDNAIAQAVDMLLNHQQLTVQDGETVAAALEDFRRKPSLGFSDCLILAIARKAGHVPLGTFDRNLAKREGAQKL